MVLAIVAPMTGATDAADAATVDPIVPIALETPDRRGSGTPMAVLAVFARAAAALAPARNVRVDASFDICQMPYIRTIMFCPPMVAPPAMGTAYLKKHVD